MEKIKDNIYVETEYLGCNRGGGAQGHNRKGGDIYGRMKGIVDF